MMASERGRGLLKLKEVDVNHAKTRSGETSLDVSRERTLDDVERLLEKVPKVMEDITKGVDGSVARLHTITETTRGFSHKSMKHPDTFPSAVRRLGLSCVPCSQPCTSIKLLELIDCPRDVLNTIEANAKTLIEYVDDDQREELENLVKTSCKQYILAGDVAQSAGMMSAFHAVFPLQEADLASVELKASSDKSWSLFFNNGRITKTSVSEMELIDFLDNHDAQMLPLENGTKGVVTAIYSVSGGLTYTGDSRLFTTGGVQLGPTSTGPVKITAGFEYTVTSSGQVVLCETDPAEWIIGVEVLDLEEMYVKKEQATQ